MAEPPVISGQIEQVMSEHITLGILTGIQEVHHIDLSFVAGLQCAPRVYFPYKVTVNKIRGIVTAAIAATDNGTITAANSTGAMANGVITALASDPLNTEYSASPTTNNVIEQNSYVQLTSAKTTVGGQVYVTLEVTRTP